MIRLTCRTSLARAALVLLALALSPTAARAQQDNQPYPPDATVSGLKTADWVVAWFQWRFSLPRSADPDAVTDPNGERANIGQRAPVWFLPIFNVGTGSRTFTVPEGHAILASVGWTYFVAPPGRYTDAELLARLNLASLDQIAAVSPGARLDDVAVTDLKRYRVITPVFSLTLPPDNLLGMATPPGADPRMAAVAAGHFCLFPPPPVGTHVYRVGGPGLPVDWTVQLVVQKPNAPLP